MATRGGGYADLEKERPTTDGSAQMLPLGESNDAYADYLAGRSF